MTGKRLYIFLLVAMSAGCNSSRPADEPLVAGIANEDVEIVRSWLSAQSSPAVVPTSASKSSAVAPVGDMLAGLESRLAQNPDDVSGWRLLAQSYAYVGRMQEAQAAADEAVRLGANREQLDAAMLAVHGQASH